MYSEISVRQITPMLKSGSKISKSFKGKVLETTKNYIKVIRKGINDKPAYYTDVNYTVTTYANNSKPTKMIINRPIRERKEMVEFFRDKEMLAYAFYIYLLAILSKNNINKNDEDAVVVLPNIVELELGFYNMADGGIISGIYKFNVTKRNNVTEK